MAGNKRKSKANKQKRSPQENHNQTTLPSGVTTRQQAHRLASVSSVNDSHVSPPVIQSRSSQKRRQEETTEFTSPTKRSKHKEDMQENNLSKNTTSTVNEGRSSSSPEVDNNSATANTASTSATSTLKASTTSRAKPRWRGGNRLSSGGRGTVPVLTQSGGISQSSSAATTSSARQGTASSQSSLARRTTPSPFDSDFNVEGIRSMLFGRGVPSTVLNHSGIENALIHEYMGSNAAANVNKMITQLADNIYDPDSTFLLLTEMNQYLLVAGEEGIMRIRYREMVDAFKPILTSDIHSEESKTMCLNVLSHLMDSWPRAAGTVITLLPEIVQLVQNCYMGEIFERVIHCMEHLSRRQGYTILSQNCINKLLPVFEFLTSSQLRTALQLVSNCVQAIPSADEVERLFHNHQECVRFLITRGLKMADRECVEITCDVLQHLVAMLSPTHQHLLPHIVSEEFLVNLQSLLVASPMVLRSFAVVLRIFTDLCQHSPGFAYDVIKTDMSATLVYAIRGTHDPYQSSSVDLSQALSALNHDDVYETVALIAELMPRLPKDVNGKPLYVYGSPHPLPTCSTRPLPQNHIPARWYYRLSPAISFTPLPSTICQILEEKQRHMGNKGASERVLTITEDQALGHGRRKEKLSSSELAICNHVQNILGFPLTINLSQKQITGTKTSAKLQRLPPSENEENNFACERVQLLRSLEQESTESLDTSQPHGDDSIGNIVRRTLFALYPLVVDICRDTTSADIKCKAIEALLRLLCYVPAPMIKSLHSLRSLSGLVMDLFSNHDSHVLIGVIHFTQLLLDKLPQHMARIYKKEGLLHKIAALSSRTEKTLANKMEKHQSLLNETAAAQEAKPTSASHPITTIFPPGPRTTRRRRGVIGSGPALIQPMTVSSLIASTVAGASQSVAPLKPTRSSIGTHGASSVPGQPISRLNRILQPRSTTSTTSSSSGVAPNPTIKVTMISNQSANPSPAQEVILTEIQELKWIKEALDVLTCQIDQYAATPDHIHENTVSHLRQLGDRLKNSIDQSSNAEHFAEMGSVLKEISDTLVSGTSLKPTVNQQSQVAQDDAFISPFEIIQCGLIEALLAFLTSPTGDRRRRVKLFCEVFLQRSDQDSANVVPMSTFTSTEGSSSKPPLSCLVAHLLSVLHHQEQFPVLPAPLPRKMHLRAIQAFPISESSGNATLNATSTSESRPQVGTLRRVHSYPGDPYVPRLQCSLKPKVKDAQISATKGTLLKTTINKRSSEGSSSEPPPARNLISTTTASSSLISRPFSLSLDPLSTAKELGVILCRLHQRHNLHTLQLGTIRIPSTTRLGLDMSTSSGEFEYDDDEEDDEDEDDEDDIGELSLLAHSMDDEEEEEEDDEHHHMIDEEEEEDEDESDISAVPADNIRALSAYDSGRGEKMRRRGERSSSGGHAADSQHSYACLSGAAATGAVTSTRTANPETPNAVIERLLMEPSESSGVSGSTNNATITRPSSNQQQLSGRQQNMLDLLEYLEDWGSLGRGGAGSVRAGVSSGNTASTSNSISMKLFINGHEIAPHMTLYEAVMRFGGATCTNDPNHSTVTDVWANTHCIDFEIQSLHPLPTTSAEKRPCRSSGSEKYTEVATSSALTLTSEELHLMPLADNDARASTTKTTSMAQNRLSRKRKSASEKTSPEPAPTPKLPVVLRMMLPELPPFEKSGEGITGEVGTTLSLLQCLHVVNRYWYTLYNMPDTRLIIPEREFVSVKLCGKASRQLQSYFNVLTNTLPHWLIQLMQQCAFLFNFDAKLNFFYLHNCDRDRAQAHLSSMGVHDETHGANFGQPSSHLHPPHRPDLQHSTTGSTLSSGTVSVAGTSHTGALLGHSSGALRRTETTRSHPSSTTITPVLNKTRVTITRDTSLLQQAESGAFASLIPSSGDVLEIQFAGEVGFGLGPTQEFYTLLSRELMREDLKLWHHNGVVNEVTNSEIYEANAIPIQYVIPHPPGLFPRPVSKTEDISTLLRRFHFLGSLLGRALLDQRLLDLPLSPLMFRCLMTRYDEVTGADLYLVDPSFTRHIRELSLLVQQVKTIRRDQGYTSSSEQAIAELGIDQLYLNFILPGYDVELLPNGKLKDVTADNLEEYTRLVVSYFLYEGVARQLQAFREGFHSVISTSRLSVFQPEELQAFLCGGDIIRHEHVEWHSVENEYWTVRSLMQACHLDHGYMADSPAVRYLFQIMSQFNREERRLFLQFVTGSPRLPLGGFQALRPPLTIVMKRETNCATDDQLPSVMTCQSYLKLPNYSSLERMREKLLLAIREGQQAFLLS